MALLDISARFQDLRIDESHYYATSRLQSNAAIDEFFSDSSNTPMGFFERENDLEGKVFIGGISWQTTPAMLSKHFGAFGIIADISLMKDKYTGQPRGFGFIKFDNPLAVDLVLAQTEHYIDGRCVDVKRAVSKSEAPGPGKNPRCLDGHKIFVGGLAPSVTVVDFRMYFERFGPVSDAIVMYDRLTQRSRGFGFVTFHDDYAVRNVLMGNHELHGKLVDVKHAEPRDSRRSVGALRDSPGLLPFSSLSHRVNPFINERRTAHSPPTGPVPPFGYHPGLSSYGSSYDDEYERLTHDLERSRYRVRRPEYEVRSSLSELKHQHAFRLGSECGNFGEAFRSSSEKIRGYNMFADIDVIEKSRMKDIYDYNSFRHSEKLLPFY